MSTGGDILVHLTAAGGCLRALAARTTETVEEARRRHDAFPTAAAALGRTLTGAALLGAVLKGQQRLMIEIVGDGPLGKIVAEADAAGNVRGYVHHPHVHLPSNAQGKLDVAGAVGSGHLYVVKDLGLREPYRGLVPLVSGEIAEDLAYYLNVSEQTPSACILGVLVAPEGSVRAAGGILIQMMPGAQEDEELVQRLEERIRAMPALSRSIDEGLGPLEILLSLLEGMEPKRLEERPVRFHCSCSKERFSSGLVSLGKEELEEIARTQGGAELVCHFCGQVYHVSEDELRALIAQAGG